MAIKNYFINNKKLSLEILEQLPSYFKFKINNKFFEVSIEKYNPQQQFLNLLINNNPISIKYSKQHKQNKDKLLIFIINKCFQIYAEQIKNSSTIKEQIGLSNFENTQNTNDPFILKSPLAGRIVKIFIQEGDLIKQGQTLLIIESMKMENEFRAAFNGIIKNILISEGNLVQQNQVLINFKKDEGDKNDASKYSCKKKLQA